MPHNFGLRNENNRTITIGRGEIGSILEPQEKATPQTAIDPGKDGVKEIAKDLQQLLVRSASMSSGRQSLRCCRANAGFVRSR